MLQAQCAGMSFEVLMQAIQAGNLVVVRSMCGADTDGALQESINYWAYGVVQDGYGSPKEHPLIRAVCTDDYQPLYGTVNFECLYVLLKSFVWPNEDEAAIHGALYRLANLQVAAQEVEDDDGHLACMLLLLTHGANPNADIDGCQTGWAAENVRARHLFCDFLNVEDADEPGYVRGTVIGHAQRALSQRIALVHLRRCWIALRGCARAVAPLRRLQVRAAERCFCPPMGDSQPAAAGYLRVAAETLVGRPKE